jgi:general secretion pathway protein D
MAYLKYDRFYLVFIAVCLSVMVLPARSFTQPNAQEGRSKRSSQKIKKKISFDYSGKPLVDIINDLAALKELNIILPQGPFAITTKVTFSLPDKITVDQAWQQVITLLDLAGYTIHPDGDFLEIVKTTDNPNIVREPFTLYVDRPLDELPNSEEIIRALFYLSNLSVKVMASDLTKVLQDMLSPNADIKFDLKTNSLLLTDKSVNIKGVMKIIQELDQGGLRDTIEVLPLYYVSAQVLDDLFNKQLFVPQQQNGTQQLPQASYFPRNTKVLALERTNSLVMMGTPAAIGLVKDFIIKYIDRPLESGESILHIYDLQYLNATNFAPVLQQLVTPSQAQGAQTTGKATGPRQYFKDVIIQAEITRKTEQIQPTQPGGTPTGSASPTTEGTQLGGNRLIIAARKKDWVRIKKLIEDLDKPQPQVALEVLLVDLTLLGDKILGAQIRDKAGFQNSTSPRLNFQSAQLAPPVLIPGVQDPITGQTVLPGNALMANLLEIITDANGNRGNIASNATPGSLIISLNDKQTGGVWAVFQILNKYANTSILAQPFLITTNHQQATVTIQQERLLVGDADTANTAVRIPFETVTAGLTVDIIPHISLTKNVNLQITVNLNEFVSNTSNNRITRVVQTCANVGSGEVLAIGGLIKKQEQISTNQVPLLGSIPLVGWFFKQEEKSIEKDNLVIFISPTIIEPQLKGGINDYTTNKLEFAKNEINEGLCFENLRDPITRWFFKPDPRLGARTIEGYKYHSLRQNDGLKPLPEKGPVFAESIAADELENSFDLESERLKKLVHNEKNPLAHSSNESAN